MLLQVASAGQGLERHLSTSTKVKKQKKKNTKTKWIIFTESQKSSTVGLKEMKLGSPSVTPWALSDALLHHLHLIFMLFLIILLGLKE